VVTGSTYDSSGKADLAVVRYNSDGSLDSTFDTDGKVITAVSSGNNYGYAIALQPNDKIIVLIPCNNGSNNDFALVQYNHDGSLDTSFSGDGIVMTSTGDDYPRDMALQSDGQIVVAGWSNNGSNDDFTLVRYQNTLSAQPLIDEANAGDTITLWPEAS
jgi:uncharacterized delta-60 repeat protein